MQHHVREPYGVAQPIHRQVHPAPGGSGLRVDRGTQVFLEQLSARLADTGFRPGDPVVALDFMPGLVHFLGGRSPGFPFYHFDPERMGLNCLAIRRAALEGPPFLILGQPMLREQAACFEGFRFPDDFRDLGVLGNPYERVHPRFFGGPRFPYVHLYGPADGLR